MIRADRIIGLRDYVKNVVLEITNKPVKEVKPAAKSKAKKVASILIVAGLASFMLCGNSFALLRPRNMDQVTTDTWTFQNVDVETALAVTGTLTGDITGDVTGDVTGAVDGIVGGNTPAAGSFTTLAATSQVVTSVLKGIDIDTTSAGADANYFAADFDVAQGAVASGAYLSRGNLLGTSSSVTSIGNIDAVYASYSLSSMTMATDTEANQLYGGIFMSNVSGAHTLTLHDGVMGAQLTVDVDAGVTDITGGQVSAAFIWPNVKKSITSAVYGAYIKCTSYCDFGQSIQVESNHLTAASRIQATDSAVLPIGLQFSTDVGTITKDIELQNGETIDNNTDGVINAVGNFQVFGAAFYAGDSASTDANTYVLDATPNMVVTTPAEGQIITWTSDTAGDGASTLSVDGVSDTLQDRAGNATAAGDVIVGPMQAQFDGTNWRLIGI